jgi:hypothetical protein
MEDVTTLVLYRRCDNAGALSIHPWQVSFNGNAAQAMGNDVKKGFPCKGSKCIRSSHPFIP